MDSEICQCGHAEESHVCTFTNRRCIGCDCPDFRFHSVVQKAEPLKVSRSDELVDVIAVALRAEPTHYNSRLHADKIASMALAALVSRYGEPEIEEREMGYGPSPDPYWERRLVFPWQEVKE